MAVAPMKATSGTLPTGPGWAYEIKWDGMRLIVDVGPSGVQASTSNNLDATPAFPELEALGPSLAPLAATLDGEMVALDDRGRPSFERLQHRMHVSSRAEGVRRSRDVPVEFVVFDLVSLGGNDTTGLGWSDRRRLLEGLADDLPPGVGLSQLFGDGRSLLEACREQGLEGVVAKRTDSSYVPGTRTRSWVKVKVRRQQELVVGGWVEGEGNRAGGLGSLLVGFHDRPGAPELRYAGRVGSGFTDTELRRVEGLLAPLAVLTCPFTPPPPPLHARGAHWVRPEMVAEVAFGEWTDEGRLRHPVYLGQRIDVAAAMVVREPVAREP